MKTKTLLLPTIFLLIMGLACSLAAEVPPTLAPSTPSSTITPQDVMRPPTVEQQVFNPPAAEGQNTSATLTPLNITIPRSISQVDGNRMLNDIATLVGFESRHVLSATSPTTGIAASQKFLEDELERIKAASPFANDGIIDIYKHEVMLDFADRTTKLNNVFMVMTGTDGQAGIVMLTAHYDTVSMGDWTTGNNFQPGANDNGSGTAALLEIARLITQERHRATIVIVFFTAEEVGKVGSQEFVNGYLKANNIGVVGVINMDIVGSPTGRRGNRFDNELRVFSAGPNDSSNSRNLARMIHYAAQRYVPEMNLKVQDQEERSGRWGDHQSFSDAGYPAVRLIQASDEDTYAHTTSDTIDRIDPAYLRRATQVALAGVLMLADGPNAPTLKPLRPSEIDPASMVLEWSHNPFCESYIIALRRSGSLTYDDFHTSQVTSVSWSEFNKYEAVTVGCIDQQGRLGRFAPELRINPAS